MSDMAVRAKPGAAYDHADLFSADRRHQQPGHLHRRSQPRAGRLRLTMGRYRHQKAGSGAASTDHHRLADIYWLGVGPAQVTERDPPRD
jgi:hypothetical protein